MTAPHRLDLRIYYEDTDFSGVVYHANYLRFLERGRTEFLRALDISQADLFAGREGSALHFAVTRIEIDFRKPARMDDLVRVETGVAALAGASLAMHQRLLRRDDVLIEATVKIAALSRGRVVRLPKPLREKLGASLPPALPSTSPITDP